jgi:hypothetical protein
MLTHPDGSLMINKAAENLDLSDVDEVYVTVLKEHLDQFNFKEALYQSFLDVNITCKIIELENPTQSQPETVYETIRKENISGSIFIKDCDSSFFHKVCSGNYVTICDANTVPEIRQLGAKSFVSYDENLILNNIVEKQIVSPFFCTGGYSFTDAKQFCERFKKICNYNSPPTENLYISHIIFDMMLDKANFTASHVSNYYDWGTIEDWDRYKRKYATLFIDIDGIIFKNTGKYTTPKWSGSPMENNINYLKKLSMSNKIKIIFTTSRQTSHEEETEKALALTGIKYDKVIYDLPHAQRIVINDYAVTNPHRSCDAINIKRDSDELESLIKNFMN